MDEAHPHVAVSEPWRWLLATLSVAAGAIHLVMVPQHAQESLRMGLAFALAGWCQIAIGAVLLARARPHSLYTAVVGNLCFIAVWAVSRTAGLPEWSGDGGRQEIASIDLLCVLIEGAVVVAAIVALVAPGMFAGLRRGALAAAGAAPLAVLVATTLVLTAQSTAEHVHGDADAELAGGLATGTTHDHDDAAPHGSVVDPITGSTTLTTEHAHAESDITYADLPADTKAEIDQVIALWQNRFPTAADAVAGGWSKATRSLYGIGAHYISGKGLASDTFDMLDPNILLYDGEGLDAKFAGVSYVVKFTAPEGFTGPYDVWHAHSSVCTIAGQVVSLTEENSDVWLSESDCLTRGGRLQPLESDQMMHLWIGPDYIGTGPIMSHDHPLLLDGYNPQQDG